MIEAKLLSALGSTVVAVILAGIAWLVALLAQRLLNRSIGSTRFYSVVVVLGLALSHAVPAIWTGPRQGAVQHGDDSMRVASERVGLDTPFIPPKEAELEKFPGQLERSLEALSPAERTTATEAIGFLTFSVMADLTEKDPKRVDSLSELDMVARSLTRLYRFAQKNGGSMTLRRYVDLAEEFKRQKPHWWRQYVESVKK